MKKIFLFGISFLVFTSLLFIAIYFNQGKTKFYNECKGKILISGDRGQGDQLLVEYNNKTLEKKQLFSCDNFLNLNLGKQEFWLVKNDPPYTYQELCKYDYKSKKLISIIKWAYINFVKRLQNGFIIVGNEEGKFGDTIQDRWRLSEWYDDNGGIYFINDLGEKKELYFGNISKFRSYSFSPDGTKAAYLEEKMSKQILPDGPYYLKSDLKIYDFNSKKEAVLIENIPSISYLSKGDPGVAWSPDGRKIAYVAIHDTKFTDLNSILDMKAKSAEEIYGNVGIGIYVYSFEDNTEKFVGYGSRPIWRPDRKALLVNYHTWPLKDQVRVIFLDTNTTQDLNIRGADWMGAASWVKLSPHQGAVWSPDGKFFAYIGGPQHIFAKVNYIYCLFFGQTGRPYWVWIKEVDSGREECLKIGWFMNPRIYWTE